MAPPVKGMPQAETQMMDMSQTQMRQGGVKQSALLGSAGSASRPATKRKAEPPPKPKGENPKVPVIRCVGGIVVISAKDWQEEKCRMLAVLQRHLRRPANEMDPLFLPGYAGAYLFDSVYSGFNPDHPGAAQRQFWFDGRIMRGHEVNYYFQGMIAKALGVPSDELNVIVRTWKFVAHLGAKPSLNTMKMTRLGYESYEKDLEECRRVHGK